MTDKTSTAPVMSLREASGRLRLHADFQSTMGHSGKVLSPAEIESVADAIDTHLAYHPAEQTRGDGVEVWMIRRNDGEVHWDETGCVFHDEASASQEARLMTDSDPDGYSFGAFVLRSSAPRQAVPDGWHKIGFIELSALARLMQGSKQSETLFVIGGGCQPQDVYVKLAAAPSAGRMGVES